METIIITAPDFLRHEAEAITALLDSGAANRVHVRKPRCAERDMRTLLEAIPPRLRGRISLHDLTDLATAYGIGGVHLNGRNPTAPECFDGIVSRSCHSARELSEACGCDYMFLSPVFDSISKPGYGGRLEALAPAGCDLTRTFALGGVTPGHFWQLREAGFRGAALLGYVWEGYSDKRLRDIITEITRNK